MIAETYLYNEGNWNKILNSSLDSENSLVVIFGCSRMTKAIQGFDEIVSTFSNSVIIGCSTSGEIYEDELYENSLSVVVMRFEKTKLKLSVVEIDDTKQSFHIGSKLAYSLFDDELKAIFVLSDGLNINGSKLTNGLSSVLEDRVSVTGGLAGDDANFEKTWVIVDGKPTSNYVTAVGFYGDNINLGHGSKGGWDKFGIDRKVTFSDNNILYELDNQPALEIYKKYLGDKADELPSSALLFPLIIKEKNKIESTVRTVLAVDEEKQSITFAGDIPNGCMVTFMKANFDNLIDGAAIAVEKISLENYNNENAVNIAISCVGRKLVLGQRTEDEIEVVKDSLGKNVSQIGYYSYGEISPLSSGICDLHNQTMTLTLIWES